MVFAPKIIEQNLRMLYQYPQGSFTVEENILKLSSANERSDSAALVVMQTFEAAASLEFATKTRFWVRLSEEGKRFQGCTAKDVWEKFKPYSSASLSWNPRLQEHQQLVLTLGDEKISADSDLLERFSGHMRVLIGSAVQESAEAEILLRFLDPSIRAQTVKTALRFFLGESLPPLSKEEIYALWHLSNEWLCKELRAEVITVLAKLPCIEPSELLQQSPRLLSDILSLTFDTCEIAALFTVVLGGSFEETAPGRSKKTIARISKACGDFEAMKKMVEDTVRTKMEVEIVRLINTYELPLERIWQITDAALKWIRQASDQAKRTFLFANFLERIGTHNHLKDLTACCPNLQTLMIRCGNCLPAPNGLDELKYLKNTSNLTRLHISDGQDLDSDPLRNLRHVPKLTELSLVHTYLGLYPLKELKHVTCLTQLTVTYTNFEPFALKHLQYVTRLRSLEITPDRTLPGRLHPHALMDLKFVPQLTSLNVYRCNELEPDFLKNLVLVTNLRSLNVSNTVLGGDALKHLRFVPHLSDLDISYCMGLARDALKSLESVPQLTSLKFEGCGLDRSFIPENLRSRFANNGK